MSLDVSGTKYCKVWEPKIDLNRSEKIVFARLSSSQKVKSAEGAISYEWSNWNVSFVGDAFEPAKALRNKDTIDILSGMVKARYDKDKDKEYIDVVVFQFALSASNDTHSNEKEEPAATPNNALAARQAALNG